MKRAKASPPDPKDTVQPEGLSPGYDIEVSNIKRADELTDTIQYEDEATALEEEFEG